MRMLIWSHTLEYEVLVPWWNFQFDILLHSSKCCLKKIKQGNRIKGGLEVLLYFKVNKNHLKYI